MNKTLLVAMALTSTLSASAQKPVYLDETQPLEARVKDAL